MSFQAGAHQVHILPLQVDKLHSHLLVERLAQRAPHLHTSASLGFGAGPLNFLSSSRSPAPHVGSSL